MQWLCLGSVPTCRGKKMLGEFSSAPTLKTTSLNYDFTADHTNYVQWSTDGQNFSCLPEHQVQLSRRARPFFIWLMCSSSPQFSEAKPQQGSRGIQHLLCPTFTLQSSLQQEAEEPKMDFLRMHHIYFGKTENSLEKAWGKHQAAVSPCPMISLPKSL